MKLKNFNLKKVEFSRNDIKLGITIPKNMTKELAYMVGVHIGDGYLGIFKRKDGWAYLNTFSGDYKEEMDFHKNIISPLVFKIYNKKVKTVKSTKNTVQIVFKSKAISTFKHNVLGLPSGKKKGKITIPDSIMNSRFRKHCLQGIVDTDFSLSFRHGTYPKIRGVFQIEDKKLKDQVMKIFKDLKISSICSIVERKDFRYHPIKKYKVYEVEANGKENLKRWADLVGFKNPKHITKMKLWETTGFCRPLSTINERKNLLPR